MRYEDDRMGPEAGRIHISVSLCDCQSHERVHVVLPNFPEEG